VRGLAQGRGPLRAAAQEMPSLLGSTLSALLDLVYPPRCAACGDPASGEAFCPVCASALDPVPPGCARCGLPGPDPVCGACLAAPPAFASVHAAGLFGGPLADAVHALKYGGRPAVGRPLGAWLARRAPLPDGALLVAVPLGRARRIARGYDQASIVADGLARAAAGRVRRVRGVLVRVRETGPQVGRSRAERLRNVAGAFRATADLRGRLVILVDDVVTTGATADAAAEALVRAGARAVHVVALARAG
jgi:ComF family protein